MFDLDLQTVDRKSAQEQKGGRPPVDQQRRRLLLSLGYGAASVATLAAIGAVPGSPAMPTSTDDPSSPPPAGLADGGTEVLGTTQLAPATESPVVFDASRQSDASALFDVVLAGGRVMDPASGFDQVANVGIIGDAIAYIGLESLAGSRVIDVSGQTVSPGFIDILSYRPNSFGVWFKVADGVTTNLGMHGINNYANAFFNRFTDSVPVNFGGAFHHQFHRGLGIEASPDSALSAGQMEDFERLTAEQLAGGYGGIAFSPEYAPGTTTDEMVRLANLATAQNGTLFFHVRYSDPDPPGTNAEAIAEVLDIAKATGRSVHISHITSTGGTFTMADTLATVNAARAEGVDVTACLYPYDFWATRLQSFRFAGDWRSRFRIDYDNLQVGGTEERLTADTYQQAFDDNMLVAALGSIPQAEIDLAMQQPWTMIGSDAIADPGGNNHPRASGTFARTLGVYLRERNVLSLMDALAKMTILPARRTEGMLPGMSRKGRMQIGADADITVFDPATIMDRASVASPATTSVGISTVMVNGVPVMEQGAVQQDRLPGRAMRSG